MSLKTQEIYLYGRPICPGIAVGKPFLFALTEKSIPNFPIAPEHVEQEIKRYKKAVEEVEKELILLRNQVEEKHILEGSEILATHQQMIRDPLLTEEVESQIGIMGKNAEFVFTYIIKQYQKKFNLLADPVFKERFKDLQDISNRILNNLLKNVHFSLFDIPAQSIIFSRDFTPSDVAEAKRGDVKALVSLTGGIASHAAIVAKANGIPFITHVDFEKVNFASSQFVIVDGGLGCVIINPSKKTLAHYDHLYKEDTCRLGYLEGIGQLPAETYDGYSIRVSANIDVLNEADVLHKYGGNGIGLFRSEYLFFNNEKFPEEEEQFESYKKIVEKMRGLPVVIRTFDIGMEKYATQGKEIQEVNPYLGCRAIRFLLREKDIFKAQLRAIIRASVYGDVSVMFPMISSLTELKEAKKLLEEAKHEVQKKTRKKLNPLRVGSMIEVPSAAIISDLLARECDFLSIGTNDLVQYALAVDRDNHMMTNLYCPAHPCIIRLIKLIVHQAGQFGIPVTVCGEMASDPKYAALLLALGVNELSVPSRYIPVVKNAIRNMSILKATQLVNEVMKLTMAHEIDELLTRDYQQNIQENGLVFTSKIF